MSTGSILSILVYPQSGYLLVYHMGLSLVHCSYLSIGSLQGIMCIEMHISQYYDNCFKKVKLTCQVTLDKICHLD